MATLDDYELIKNWLRRPLSRRYAVVRFSESLTWTRDPDRATEQVVRWAFGSLRTGECEVLGVWAQPETSTEVRIALLAEVHARGAEFVEVGGGAGYGGTGDVLATVYPHARSLESLEQLLAITVAQVRPRHRQRTTFQMRALTGACNLEAACTELAKFQRTSLGERYPEVVKLWGEALARFEPFFALPAPLRQIVRLADRTAMEVQESLARAIHRHGPFVDSAAALDFVAVRLLRAERRLDRERAAALVGGGSGSQLSGGGSRESGALGVPASATQASP